VVETAQTAVPGAGAGSHPARNGDRGPLLEALGLTKHFPVRRGLFGHGTGRVHAVDGVSFTIGHGETVGLVGESGCGKSTVGRLVLRLLEPTAGTLRLHGEDITHLDDTALRPHRRQMQIVFQDPWSSLNPRMPAGRIVGEPLAIHGVGSRREREERVAGLLERVGLGADAMERYAHQFSGGQRQRLAIARALSLNPSLIVCDEAVSALDVSIQAQVLNLLIDLQEEYHLSYLFIAHDLAVVEHISRRVMVMYLGHVVEIAPRDEIYRRPRHPYTEALLGAIPKHKVGQRRQAALKGGIPDPSDPPPGCVFHTRCAYATERCRMEVPQLVRKGHDGRSAVACHHADALELKGFG